MPNDSRTRILIRAPCRTPFAHANGHRAAARRAVMPSPVHTGRTPHTAHRTPHTAHRTPHTAHRTPRHPSRLRPPDSGAIARTQYDSADDAGDRFDVTARPRRRRIAKLAV